VSGNTTSRLVRKYDAAGRVQMAESSVTSHGSRLSPQDNLFLVHHYEPPQPNPDPRLEIVSPATGGSRHVSIGDLRELPARRIVSVQECAGNGRGLLSKRVPGTQFGLGLFHQVEWTGVSLRDLLHEDELRDGDWTTVVVEAEDGGMVMPENVEADFAKGLPRQKALDPDTILAYEMNDGPVPHEHGGPVRLVVPGWYGIWWVKWPRRIRFSSEPFEGFWQKERYTYQADDGSVLSVVTDQLPRALVVHPGVGQSVNPGEDIEILAWAGDHQVASVDVSLTDGQEWGAATLVDSGDRWEWSRWRFQVPGDITPGLWRIAARATDSEGRVQPMSPRRNRLGYGNNCVSPVEVHVVPKP